MARKIYFLLSDKDRAKITEEEWVSLGISPLETPLKGLTLILVSAWKGKESPMEKAVLLSSGSEYFSELIETSVKSRQISLSSPVTQYLANLLTHYMDARNLYEPKFDEYGNKNPQTLAELWLTAHSMDGHAQKELLKKLGDKTLYISGFFADSLNRSLVDLDYYQSMGVSAYRSLSLSGDGEIQPLFSEIAKRFVEIVEVLNVISHESFVKSDQSILRLYESFLRTGSQLARERLQSLGVSPIPTVPLKKVSGQ